MEKIITMLITLTIAFSLTTGCAQQADTQEETGTTSLIEELGLTKDAKDAADNTIKVNSALYSELDFEDTQEADFAVKGLIDAPEDLELIDEEGNVVWSQKAYSFLADYKTAPNTVNPSLWQNTINNHAYGLFEVMSGVYQVRGYDMDLKGGNRQYYRIQCSTGCAFAQYN